MNRERDVVSLLVVQLTLRSQGVRQSGGGARHLVHHLDHGIGWDTDCLLSRDVVGCKNCVYFVILTKIMANSTDK